MVATMAFSCTRIDTLPIEIICLIFSNLDMKALLRCSRVNRHLRKIIASSVQLQYAIELGRHRMLSLLPSSSNISYNMLLNQLRNRGKAWKYLDWNKRETLELPPTGSVYEFVGGLYGNGREDDSRVTASISFLELPTTDTPDGKSGAWTHSMGDTTIVDFTMDPSQDLLILVALARPESKHVYELHLRSIKTNQPHPRACAPVLPCLLRPNSQAQSSDVVAAVRVQAAGSIMALLIKEVFEGPSAHLEIWKWDGDPRYSCAMVASDGIDDFTFLTHETFLLVLPTGHFAVYDFKWPMICSTIPTLRAMYNFPPLTRGYQYWYVSMSSNPAPGYVPRYAPEYGFENQQMYYPSPDERIHACCIYVYDPSSEDNHHVKSFVFFLNLRTLLKAPHEWRMKSPKNTLSPQSNGCTAVDYPRFPSFGITPLSGMHTPRKATPEHFKEIEWSEWGPENTRWFEENISTDWQHAVYGLRTVESIELAKVQRPSQVADFNRFLRETSPAEEDLPESDPLEAKAEHGHGQEEGAEGYDQDDDDIDLDAQRCLRLRDFNPYSFADFDASKPISILSEGRPTQVIGELGTDSKGRCRFRRLVNTPSTLSVNGVFEHDIVSSLPYVEVVSEEMFEVTDVMMDDSRLLLLKRGDSGRLERLDVLVM
ncbi:hypothetical protein CPC08DRAFT_746151 [Agrocybe pediades]|nr:hypothetical protein CPC08DRAFT_746151 [Agrocybe pediades]